MKRTLSLLASFAVAAAFAGCDSSETKTTSTVNPPQTTTQADGGHSHEHLGEKHNLGRKDVAEKYAVQVTQVGEIKPGAEVAYEIRVADITNPNAKPPPVRAWVGTEAGEGTAKKLAVAAHGILDADIEIPADALPAGSKLWVELELEGGKQTTSFDLPEEGHEDHGDEDHHAGEGEGEGKGEKEHEEHEEHEHEEEKK